MKRRRDIFVEFDKLITKFIWKRKKTQIGKKLLKKKKYVKEIALLGDKIYY